jgi:hypothetical protein
MRGAYSTLGSNYKYIQEVLGRTNHLLSFDVTLIAKKTTCSTNLLLLRVFVAAVTFSPSHCLATTDIQTHRWERFMKHTVEMGSGAVIYIQCFIKIGSGILNLIGVVHINTGGLVIS